MPEFNSLSIFEAAANLLDPPEQPEPVQWVEQRLGEALWSKQVEILNSVRDNIRTAVQSAHSTGKSHSASRIVAWFLENHEPGEAFVVSTAPTYAQVRAILWRYIRQIHAKAGLKGRVNQTEWHIADQLVGFGRKPADYDESAFQGIHARKVLVLLDEAGGVPEGLWDAAETLITNDDCRILAIGNPDNPQSHFKKVCESKLWHNIKISAFDSPNLTGEVFPAELKRHLVSRAWVETRKEDWGEDSPLYQSKVLGEFPSENPNSMISLGDLSACRIPQENASVFPIVLGVDVAGGGRDATVIRERRGVIVGRQWTSKESDPEKVADWLVNKVMETGATRIRIDSTGLGWGVVGLVRKTLAERDLMTTIQGVNSAEASSKPKRYVNARAEMWWTGRELARTRGWDFSQAHDVDSLFAELCQPNYDLDPTKARIRVESKDDVIARLGRSPDRADALLLAFYDRGAYQGESEKIEVSVAEIGLGTGIGEGVGYKNSTSGTGLAGISIRR